MKNLHCIYFNLTLSMLQNYTSLKDSLQGFIVIIGIRLFNYIFDCLSKQLDVIKFFNYHADMKEIYFTYF